MAKLAPKDHSGDNQARIAGHCLSGDGPSPNDAAGQEPGGCSLPPAALMSGKPRCIAAEREEPT